jgi:glycosyltransferase involved in cell wall biosynthesis
VNIMTIDKPEFLKTVSIIVPAHNEASSLPHPLNALNNQTYPKELVEIIVVDNRSSDDTARGNGYQKGQATIMNMPHLAALSPRAIATHLRSRNIEVNVRRVFSTCFAGVGVLACGLLYSLYFSANKTKILSKPRQQIAT